jgi:NAD(P)-dependent dehydrogenase (short-subunit alcohol dehydrogenase family)
MDLQLAGRIALVTGGSRGIGRAVAARLAGEGAVVAIAARDLEVATATAAELSASSGSTVAAFAADMGREQDVQRMVDAVSSALGTVSILVNNAATAGGRVRPPALADITRDALVAEIDVKVLGYIRAAQGVAPGMRAAGWGRIINVSGLAALTTGSTIGSIRNVAVAALTKNMADELGPDGINVTCVHPGLTRTRRRDEAGDDAERAMLTAIEERIPRSNSIRQMIDADDVATLIAFLASPLSRAVNGESIACGGGLPGTIRY